MVKRTPYAKGEIEFIMKVNFLFILIFSFVMAGNDIGKNVDGQHHLSGKHEEKVDGSYIMHHIQDDRVFELFNPLDWNDNNHDHYYYTKKISLDHSWNRLEKVPLIGKYLSWMWDPSTSLSPMTSDDQLIINKQLFMMLLASLLIILLFIFGYKKNKKVQSGIGNLLEVFVVFIRDEVVYPNMGKKQGKRFLPLILTFFFFIVMLNLLGLIPGSATATASFSVTVALALITFFTYIIFGNKDFWKHIFATPGVPFWLLPIMIPVELIGLLTKPFALSVRLLANMNAGHIIILAFLGIIINMKSGWVALGSVPMALAINMLEIFVAFLQGYIFSLLSSIFIGMAVLEHEEH